MAEACHGNGFDHCCYVNGQVCPFLELDTVSGRHWVCGLRRELGSWAAVHADPRYLSQVKPVWLDRGVADCGDFRGVPNRDQCCFADQYALTYNTQGKGAAENGLRRAEYGPGARSAGKSL